MLGVRDFRPPIEVKPQFGLILSDLHGGSAMYDGSIHTKTVARQFRPFDFVDEKLLLDEAFKAQVIDDAVRIGAIGFGGLQIKKSNLKGKPVYQLTGYPPLLVARHIAANVRRITGVKQDNRQFIIECLRSLLQEGLPFRAYRLDIKNFYESVDGEQVVDDLRLNEGFSGQSAFALRSFFAELKSQGVHGLPRGLGLSATLAEYHLRAFDDSVTNTSEVWFYVRFVDDIFIITSGREERAKFEADLQQQLPDGLDFNSKKCVVMDFEPFTKGQSGVEHVFSYLGYQFEVSRVEREVGGGSVLSRNVAIDIAPSKVQKLKTRIIRALIAFKKDGDYNLLKSRIRLLTSNFNFVDRQSGIRRVSGIYFNYPMADIEHSRSLPHLDRFLRNSLMSPHPGNKWRPAITKAQRRELLNLTFSGGFRSRRFYSFGPSTLAKLVACWRYA